MKVTLIAAVALATGITHLSNNLVGDVELMNLNYAATQCERIMDPEFGSCRMVLEYVDQMMDEDMQPEDAANQAQQEVLEHLVAVWMKF